MKLNYDIHSLHEITMLGCLAFEQQLEFQQKVRDHRDKMKNKRTHFVQVWKSCYGRIIYDKPVKIHPTHHSGQIMSNRYATDAETLYIFYITLK